MRVVIIEDEVNNQIFLENALQKFVEGVTIIGKAENVKAGIHLINTTNPDIVYLDIELPDGSGFDILEKIDDKNINVIFITAFENYAVKAFRYSAIDYLLKPFNIEELIDATDRAKVQKENKEMRISFLQEQVKIPTKKVEEILIDGFDNFVKVELNKIIALVADSNFVCIQTDDGEKVYCSKTLKFYEDLLDEKIFKRIHRSHIINVKKITQIDKGRTGYVTLTNQEKYEIAARRKPMLLNAMKD
jgi:two-component system LytT family response regulator